MWCPHGLCMALCTLCSPLHPSSVANMPKMSKAQKARQNNLQKARDTHKATVEEVPDEGDIAQQTSDSEYDTLHTNHFNDPFYPESDSPNEDNWDLDLGNELPDIDCDNISDGPQELDLDEEIVVAPEITEETALDEFSHPRLGALPQGCFFLTMLQVIVNEQQMHSLPAKCHSISMKIIQQCQAGLKAWNRSSRSVGCGGMVYVQSA
ncbi:hypothetical protein K438DRAFT_1806851 [Mycena galopus ATCC 62051]|nr:hypothetical protein K438DRAFT_1806851 [Mycena galopus ATCC 62051]